ncbi:hypothetical protein NEOLEDRAFT_1080357 [Neolentinus lepideus HHB14362 ss-1]|uniref:Uncharacterized protein n=1 Tax=Neolentinus lepideus HHB14362 ss-1 TaxID=1314782 RepID=A0A165MJ56_9AGAM|nr:hypothetical protein NEOLEDRAFT_1080357 [Neolentinus lepideus HHB14362 ss-1]
MPRTDQARRVLTRIVNLLTAKQELGGPMVCAYLLGQPDHYTNHAFKPFFWQSFINEVTLAWPHDSASNVSDILTKDRVHLQNSGGTVVARSKVLDYKYRPLEMKDWPPFEFCRHAVIKPKPKAKPDDEPVHTTERQADDEVAATVEAVTGDVVVDELVADDVVADESDSEDFREDNSVFFKPLSLDDKVDPRVSYRLHPSHPFFGTHVAYVLSQDDAYVLNFLGGSLPRFD